MDGSLGTSWPGLGWVALRTGAVYFALLVGLRLAGKREVGQMTPFDLVLLLLIANAVQNAMVGPDTSLVGGLGAAAVLLLLNTLLARLAARNRSASRLLRGEPRALILHGKVIEENLRAESVRIEDLQQSLREHGVAAVAEVHLATLEVDGSISVIRQDELASLPQRPHRRIRLHRVP